MCPSPWPWTGRRKTCGVNFIGGYSALVQKGMTTADEQLIALHSRGAGARRILVCSSVNVGSTRAGINMDAVALMGRDHQGDGRDRTADRDGLGCAKLVVFCNAVEDNPFMAGAFHGVGEADMRHQRGRLRPRRGVPRPAGRQGRSPLTWWRRPSKRPPSGSPAWASWWPQEACRRLERALWHRGPVPGAHPGRGRQRGPDPGGDGPGDLRHPRHHGGAGPAERRGEEGRRHGVLPRGRPVRRLYPRVRGRGHDRRRPAPAP